MSERLTFTRGTGGASGWTIMATESGVMVTGGTHDGAYAPVDLRHDQLEALIADLRSLSSSALAAAKREGEG